MDYYSATNNNEEEERRRELRRLQREERLKQQLERRRQAAEAKKPKGGKDDSSAKSVKGGGVKDWAINLLLPKWGFIRWSRTRAGGEAMDAGGVAKIIVLIFRNVSSCLVALVVLSILVMIIGWLIGGLWAILTALYNLDWSAISSLLDLLKDAGSDIAA